MKIKTAVLPVAGQGTRFLPASKVVPKELMPVVDKPLIQYAVEEALAAGIERVILVTSRGKSLLIDHFDAAPDLMETLSRQGKQELLAGIASITPLTASLVAVRQPIPQGLGHAVLCAREAVGDEPFAVILPDDLVLSDKPLLSQMIERFPDPSGAVVAVMEVPREEVVKYGILDVESDNGEVVRARGLVEKPSVQDAPSNLAIIGRYLFGPAIFDRLAEQAEGANGEIQLTDAMNRLLPDPPVHGFRFQGERFDCGSKSGFLMANVAFGLRRPDIAPRLRPFIAGLGLTPKTE